MNRVNIDRALTYYVKAFSEKERFEILNTFLKKLIPQSVFINNEQMQISTFGNPRTWTYIYIRITDRTKSASLDNIMIDVGSDFHGFSNIRERRICIDVNTFIKIVFQNKRKVG